jgi:hypothetical protein
LPEKLCWKIRIFLEVSFLKSLHEIATVSCVLPQKPFHFHQTFPQQSTFILPSPFHIAYVNLNCNLITSSTTCFFTIMFPFLILSKYFKTCARTIANKITSSFPHRLIELFNVNTLSKSQKKNSLESRNRNKTSHIRRLLYT